MDAPWSPGPDRIVLGLANEANYLGPAAIFAKFTAAATAAAVGLPLAPRSNDCTSIALPFPVPQEAA